MKMIVYLALSAMLGGCGLMRPSPQTAFNQAAQIAQECQAKRISSELPSYTSGVECSNGRMRQTMADSGYRHMDLVGAYLAFRLRTAGQLDAGQINEADAQFVTADYYSKLSSEAQRRDAIIYANDFQRRQLNHQVWQSF